MKPRDITIITVLNGWIVKVGCQTIVFNDIEHMFGEIDKYLRYPDETVGRYQREALNSEYFNLEVGQDGPELRLGQLTETIQDATDEAVLAVTGIGMRV